MERWSCVASRPVSVVEMGARMRHVEQDFLEISSHTRTHTEPPHTDTRLSPRSRRQVTITSWTIA